MDNVGIVVEDLDAAIAFFTESSGLRNRWQQTSRADPVDG
jgi:hypothetical protein